MNTETILKPDFIVVVGASAGGIHSVKELMLQLTDEMNLSIFIVLHLAKVSLSDVMIDQFAQNNPFVCKTAEHDEPIRAKHVYLAPADKHLVIKKDKIILGEGPAENRWRPSIDVLFRSAAASYGSYTIGIILSGMLQDGTAGMIAIKRSGGTCMVQDPKQAEYPDMPLSVLQNTEVDYCLPLERMGTVLAEKVRRDNPYVIPADVKAEAAIAEKAAIGIDLVASLGEKSLYSCPDCGGGLWEMTQGGIVRYRCHIGHAYSGKELLIRQNDALENTLWVALRMMEERRMLLKKMAEEEQAKGWAHSAKAKKERMADIKVHISRLKDLLFDAKEDSVISGLTS